MFEQYQHPLYPKLAVLPSGVIFNLTQQKLILPTKHAVKNNLYWDVNIGNYKVNKSHIVVLTYFKKKPTPKHEVNHINKLKWDNRPKNLEWVTHTENLKHGRWKAVIRIDKEGIEKEYPSILIAANSNNTNTKSIGDVLRKSQKTAKGFHWRYKKDPSEKGPSS